MQLEKKRRHPVIYAPMAIILAALMFVIYAIYRS
jgi:hypothetical protein